MRWLRRSLLFSLLLGGLTQMVLWAPGFSHDQRFIGWLFDHAAVGWGITGLWMIALNVRRRFDAHGTDALLIADTPATIAAVCLLGVTATPFANAYFSHFTHPALAVVTAWIALPILRAMSVRFGTLHGRIHDGWAAGLIAALGTVVYFVQSYRRHIWFGSGGKDLGLFHQSVWLLSQGESPTNTVMGMHAFADHMEFIDFLAAPLQWIWPDAGALLLFQAAMVASGVLPIYAISRARLQSVGAAVALALVYLLGFDLQQAVMFDWNPTTCGVALLPWMVWSFERDRLWPFLVATVLLALSKENLILYGAGLCWTLGHGSQRKRRAWLTAAGLLAFFAFEMTVLFPLFREEGFRHMRFAGLGSGPWEMLGNVLGSPFGAFSLLFTPGNKVDGLLVSISGVGFLCLLAPRYVWALLPVVLERFWSSHSNRWWGHHYGAGAGVLATLAAIEGLAAMRAWSARSGGELAAASGTAQTARGWGYRVALLTVLLSAVLMSTAARFGPGPLWSWRHSYYTTAEDAADARQALAVIPRDASVAAQNHLIPHLSARREIYDLQVADKGHTKVEYVAVDFVQSAWPHNAPYSRGLVKRLLQDSTFGVTACHGQAVVLRRGATSIPCPVTDGL